MSAISRSGAGTVAAALLAAAAFAAEPGDAGRVVTDDMIDLGRVGLTVMGVGNAGFVNPGAVFPVSAVGPLDGTPILARGATNDMASAELCGYSVGRALSEQEPDYAIGEYCTDYGGRNAAEVDWERTGAFVATNPACQGFVKFVNSLQAGADRRILFTAGGAVDVKWFYKGVADPVLRTYTIASRSSSRPYRLYATRVDEPNEAAYVDLSGKFVEFFGAPNLLKHIDYDRSGSKLLTYRYTVTTNKYYHNEEVHCEQGQFVLAYYDTESKGNLLATIVVEIMPPTVHTVDATVGSELRPDGGGYDVEGLVATIRAGDKAEKEDPYAPYVEKFAAPLGMERQSPCHGKVYAITPTDASTSDCDMPMPWKVDIYWRAPDPMGTLWTFENDWYNITWPKDALKVVVSGNSSEPGACLTVPTNYAATVTGYREPATLVVGSTEWGEVVADVEGKFLVKVEKSVDPLRVWYLPVETCLREGGLKTQFVCAPRTFDWPVGKELTLVTGEAAGSGAIAEVATRMSSVLPGYVHEAVSTGRNWNPRLYHRPTPADEFIRGLDEAIDDPDQPDYDSDGDGTNDTISVTGLADPYARLDSTLYGVNASDTPIEVWWRGMVFEEGMESPITYPGLVERYRLYWNETPGLFPEIALSSKLGSAGKMGAYTGRSFVFVSSNGVARIYSPDLDGLEEVQAPEKGGDEEDDEEEPVVYHLGLRLLPPEVTDATRTLGLGRIMTLANTNGADNAELVLDLEEAGSNRVRVVASVLEHVGRKINRTECESFTLERGKWSSVTLSLPDTFLGDALDFTLGGGGCSAVCVAFDDVALWAGAGTARPADEDEYLFNFDFDMDDLETFGSTGLRIAVDAKGLTMVVEGGQTLDVGTYGEVDGLLYAEDGVAPELYWQNDPKKAGYNPNEEHAFLRQDSEDESCYVAWALRNDLNVKSDPNATPPYVLAMYPRNGRGEMRMYRVVACNSDYPEFACDVTVGQKMDPPPPLGLLEGCCSANNAAYALAADPDAMPVMTDRNFEMWARCNGPSDVYYSYPMQPGFCCPSLGDNQLEDGTYVSWMSCAGDDVREPEDFTMPEIEVNFVFAPDGDGDSDVNLNDIPIPERRPVPPGNAEIRYNKTLPWKWSAKWPADTVPTMKIGQTLVRATENLPEMFNARSMAVLWPLTNTCPVKVIDPTQVRYGGKLPVKSNFVEEYGFTLGNSGNCQLRKGKYYFTGLPPSISDRFYVDANAAESNRICLVGTWVEKPSGGSYLLPNVLSSQEREALKSICKTSSVSAKERWNAAVGQLATDYVQPSPIRVIYEDAKNGSTNKTETVFLPKDAEFVFTNYFNQVKTGVLAPGYVVTNMFVIYGDFSNNVSVVLGKTESADTAVASLERVDVKKYPIDRKDIRGFKNTWQTLWQERIPELKDFKWPTRTSDFVKYTVTYRWLKSKRALKSGYENHDHYALVADGSSSGWVVLIENDDPDTSRVPEGTPVQLHVLRVLPELHTDGIAVITDPLNKLSEQLTLHYRMPFGPGVDGFAFDWHRQQPDASGNIATNYDKWAQVVTDSKEQLGHTDHHLGGKSAPPEDYVNNYYTLRYKPDKDSIAYKYLNGKRFVVNGVTNDYTKGDIWSGWCTPQLAEGWLQRTLNTVTPFAQRVEDFYANESDIKFTMFEQIGGPYQGDVALNNDNLANVGLLELYRTMFNRVESILLSADSKPDALTKANLCKQLLLAATRVAQFYAFLGADAYADAKNPLISQGRDQFWEQEVPAADYSFANQVPSLLDEELALLRGLTSATAFPNKQEAPCFNRLRWNLTRGLTEGEVAYVNNYGIQSDKGVLDVNCAANQYPQGHGDAWGHYLSVLSTYYRLIRNPSFDWPTAMGEMLMDQTVVNVDYQDEEKFADAVEKLVQTGLDTMALTFRKTYKERGGRSGEGRGLSGALAGYSDADAEQAFGYGEWAARTGMNAIYGWMTGNALLPSAEDAKTAYSNFVDRGVSKIDRSTAPQLEAVCTLMRNLDQRLNDFESGMNPLGLSENAVPFDIDPDELAAKNTHFEQILARAEKALANCRTVLDYANVYGSQLARIQNAEADAATEKETREQEFKQQLVAVFGTPYPEDCGVNGKYAQGYDGPDIYDYNYMDLGEFDIKYPLDTVFTNSYEWYAYKFNTISRHPASTLHYQDYYVNIDGIRIKPANFTGKRATEGSIQTAYRDYLTAYSALKGSMSTYTDKQDAYLRLYNRKVVGVTKSIATSVLGLLAKMFERQDPEKDTQKMIGAMLAQSFSTVDLKMVGTLNGTGYAVDQGVDDRIKIFDRFYKGYLDLIGARNGINTNGIDAVAQLHKLDAEAKKAAQELQVAKTNLTARVAELNPILDLMKARAYQGNAYTARYAAEALDDNNWNTQDECCWRFVKKEKTVPKSQTQAYVLDDGINNQVGKWLRDKIAENPGRWYRLFYKDDGDDKGDLLDDDQNYKDVWVYDEVREVISAVSTKYMRDYLATNQDIRVELIKSYGNLLVREIKENFDQEFQIQPGPPAQTNNLKTCCKQLIQAERTVETKQEAYNKAKKKYEEFMAAKKVPPEDAEEGVSTSDKYVNRVLKWLSNLIFQNGAVKAFQTWSTLIDFSFGIATTVMDAVSDLQAAALAVTTQAIDVRNKTAALAGCEAAYRAEVYKGEEILEARELWRRQFSNNAVQYRYLDMFDRIQRSTALTKYSTAFDTAQRYVWELAKVYDYETGLLSADRQAGDRFLAEIVGTRSLGREGVPVSSGTTDGGLYDVVARLKANWDVLKPRLGMNNADKPEKWFSLRWENYRLGRDQDGDAAWKKLFGENANFKSNDGSVEKPIYCENILKDPDFVRYCQPLANTAANAGKAEPGFIIRFKTSIYNAQNFFGQPLLGGDNQFSAADYATKIDAVGVYFENYDRAVASETNKVDSVALAKEPNVYLVPIGADVMRSPAGTERKELCWRVVDQVLPLPYTIGSSELDSVGWVSSMVGFDGTSDSGAVIRRHSTLRAGYNFTSTRLVGRSAWNQEWMLVIPASSLNSNYEGALKRFRETVTDIKIGIRAYSRQGN